MNPMKRFCLVALLVVLGALLAASPALAGKSALRKGSVTFPLTPPAIDPPEPNASGKSTLSWAPIDSPIGVTVSCTRLTPGKQYCVVVFTSWLDRWYNEHTDEETYGFTADAKGRLKAEFTAEATLLIFADLWIENDAGDVVLEAERP